MNELNRTAWVVIAAGVGVFGLIALGLITAWLIPVVIAFRREHLNRVAITAVRHKLERFSEGWVVALVWSLTNPSSQTVVVNNAATAPALTLAQPVQAELPEYTVGDIINGHRFNRAQWVPINPTLQTQGRIE